MAQSRCGIEFFYGNLSNSHFPLPSSGCLFSGSPTTPREPPAAFSCWRRSCTDFCYFWPVCFIRRRKYPAFASVTPGLGWNQQPLPFARTIYHPGHVSQAGNSKWRNPHPGSNFPPSILGSRNCICGRDYLELETDANSKVKLFHVTQRNMDPMGQGATGNGSR